MSKLFLGPGSARGLRRIAFGASAGAIALLCGCATPPAATPPAPQPPQNPILQAVATSALNSPVPVAAPAGPATVTVLSDYISGEGQECRAYSLANGAAPPARKLACSDGTSWRDIPPLTPAAGTESQP